MTVRSFTNVMMERNPPYPAPPIFIGIKLHLIAITRKMLNAVSTVVLIERFKLSGMSFVIVEKKRTYVYAFAT